MLELITQRHNECFITAVAMATGMSLDTLRTRFESRANRPYAQLTNWVSPDGERVWRNVAKEITDEFATRSLTTLPPAYYISAPLESYQPRTRLTTRVLKGRGVLTVWQGKRAHAVAFEDGVIYDGNSLNPLKLADWRFAFRWSRIRDWRIDYVKGGA